jgi:hypothetical protein
MPTKAMKEKPTARKLKTSLALPAELWTAARIRALKEGIDAQDLVTRALERYLKTKDGTR